MNYITVYLDTTAPSTPLISLNDGATFANDIYVDCFISTGDDNTTNYQMKLWGDVDPANNSSIQTTEEESSWITFSERQQIKISDSDGQKTIFLKLRDDVHNESAVVSDSITYDGSKPVVTVTDPDVSKISTIEGKNVVNFSFTVNEPFTEYQVKVVSSSGATVDNGTLIPTANGSSNTSGVSEGETFDTTTSPINVSVTGNDLFNVSAGDGQKIIKVFVRDVSGLWST